MQYPLHLRFKIAAIASQIFVYDNTGNEVFYVKQKLFKFKENIEIYADSNKTQLVYTVKADRVIDFSPELTLSDQMGNVLGSVKRHGRKSIWKSTYDIKVGPSLEFSVTETNPWAKLIDGIMGEIPILGLFSGYVFHPHYQITAAQGQVVASLDKQPAFLEGKYKLDNAALNVDEATHRIFTALVMVVVLRERLRG